MTIFNQFKILLLLFISFNECVLGQNNVFDFKNLTNTTPELKETFKKSSIFEFDSQLLSGYLSASRSLANEVTFKIDEEKEWSFTLEPIEILTDETTIYTLSTAGKIKIEASPNVKTYKGYFKDGRDGYIRLTLNGTFMYGLIKDEENEYFIEPLKYYQNDSKNNTFVLYNTKDINPKHQSKNCFRPNFEPQKLDKEAHGNTRLGNCYKVKLAILADYLMYTDPAHSGLDAVINHLVGVMNNVQSNYEYNGSTNFDDGINFEISEVVVSICPTCDPLSSTQNATNLLSEFSNWVDMNGFSHPFNAAHFWSNRDFIGSTVGMAFQSGNLYCQSKARAVLEDWTSTAALLKTMVAHEVGHNFNGVHDSGAGLILSPSVSVTNTWSANSKSTINTQISTQSTCLPACGPIVCDRVLDITVSNITSDGFTLDWTHTTENLYTIKIKEAGSTTFIQEITTINNHLELTPPGFGICKQYDVFIYNNCGGSGLSAVQRIFMKGLTVQGCAEFKPAKSAGWVGNTFSFIDNSINAVSWYWDFGNGQTSTIQNPSVVYTTAGVYTVSLSVNNGIHTITKEEIIKVLPDIAPPYFESDGGNFESNNLHFASDIIEGQINVWELGTSNFTLPTLPSSPPTKAWKSLLNSNIPQITLKSGLYSPRFNFTQYTNYTLNFDIGMQTLFCNGPIAAQLQYSTNNGTTWTRLGSTTDGFYNAGPGLFCEIATQLFTDKYGWTLNQNYVSKSIDVSFLSGQSSVIFRFVVSISGIFSGGYAVDGVLIDNFEIVTAGYIPLALNVTSLSGKKIENTSVLSWNVDDKNDIHTFQILRSSDGNSFIEIGRFDAEKNIAQYNYIDKNPIQSTNYYKIVATNFDGKDHHSNIVRISHSPEVSFIIFPNPIFTDQKLNFDFGENNIEIANIKILDILGRELTNLKYDFSQKQDELKISQPGIYIIRIETESGQIFSNRILVK